MHKPLRAELVEERRQVCDGSQPEAEEEASAEQQRHPKSIL
jgi:hypothetical protein